MPCGLLRLTRHRVALLLNPGTGQTAAGHMYTIHIQVYMDIDEEQYKDGGNDT